MSKGDGWGMEGEDIVCKGVVKIGHDLDEIYGLLEEWKRELGININFLKFNSFCDTVL